MNRPGFGLGALNAPAPVTTISVTFQAPSMGPREPLCAATVTENITGIRVATSCFMPTSHSISIDFLDRQHIRLVAIIANVLLVMILFGSRVAGFRRPGPEDRSTRRHFPGLMP